MEEENEVSLVRFSLVFAKPFASLSKITLLSVLRGDKISAVSSISGNTVSLEMM